MSIHYEYFIIDDMKPFKEQILANDQVFPVEIFIADNAQVSFDSKPHYHDCLELLYVIDGVASQQINEKSLIVKEHDLIILNDGDVHCTHCINKDHVRIIVVKFLPSFIENIMTNWGESKYILAFLSRQKEKLHTLKPSIKPEKDLIQLFQHLVGEFQNKEVGYEISIKGIILQMIALLARIGSIPLFDVTLKEFDQKRLIQLLSYIEAHFNEHVDLRVAADIFNMSYSYMSRYFKRITGYNFTDYVNFVRIREFEKRILFSNMSISEAAQDVGFGNITSFNRVYKRIRGYTPSTINRTNNAKK